MSEEKLNAPQKALRINRDAQKYGTFAEIGAGQEVARWFFHVGGAAGTVAKTISAYDMAVSDAIYGSSDRYVSRSRLKAMLDHEYGLLLERLDKSRGDKSTFFVFADTVATRSFSRKEDGHGWLGVRFQTGHHGPPSEIIIHVRLLDRQNVQQQETLGIIGVNLIHGAFYHHGDPEMLIASLLDELTWERVEVDMISFSGPAFAGVDNRLMALKLVEKGLTEAAMFTAQGEAVQWAEMLYKQPVLVQRGSFRPVTIPMTDMMRCAYEKFLQEEGVRDEKPVVIMEMTLRQLQLGDAIDYQDFLNRVDMLSALGHPVMLSNFFRYHRLVMYLSRYTQKMIGLPLGLVRLKDILDEKFYTGMEGGIMESLGQLFKNGAKLYVYPSLDRKTGKITTVHNFEPPRQLTHLYRHLVENHFIEDLPNYDPACLPVFTSEVLQKIRSADPSWETLVPTPIVEVIHRKKLFGCPG